MNVRVTKIPESLVEKRLKMQIDESAVNFLAKWFLCGKLKKSR